MVTEDDPVLVGAHAFALVDYLDRAGFDVRMLPAYDRWVGSTRLTEERDANAIIHLAVGAADIQHWRQARGVIEIVAVDPATPRNRQRFNALRTRVRSQLIAEGRDSLARMIDERLFLAMTDSEMPTALRPLVRAMGHIGLPEAVFITGVLQQFP